MKLTGKIFYLRIVLVLFGSALIALAAWSGYQTFSLSTKRADIKRDYSALNNISYGLLSVNTWRDHLVNVVANRIDDFDFTPEQEKDVKLEVSRALHAMINKGDSMLQEKQKSLGGKLKKFAVRSLISTEKVHQQVPAFTETIVAELKKPHNKAKLKAICLSKVKQFGDSTYDSSIDSLSMKTILASYGSPDVPSFNRDSEALLASLQEKCYYHAFVVLGVLFFFLIAWWLLKDYRPLHVQLFILSATLAIVVLIAGLASPMIEIDARISEISFLLMGENISFHDQVIFFQSKSIIDVVRVLISTHKVDSVLVGILILVFSIVFPIGKLLSTEFYLLGSEKVRSNKIVRFFAFKSGKWSMADVNVVAIFMAYIGFKGIFSNQMQHLNSKTETMESISTSLTSLQPGFILFIAYVLFGLILSIILKRITANEEMPKAVERPRTVKPSLIGSVQRVH